MPRGSQGPGSRFREVPSGRAGPEGGGAALFVWSEIYGLAWSPRRPAVASRTADGGGAQVVQSCPACPDSLDTLNSWRDLMLNTRVLVS